MKQKTNLSQLVSIVYAAMDNDPKGYEIRDRVELARFNPRKNVTVYIYAYRNYVNGKGIDLMLETAEGRSLYPIRYDNGKIAYDIYVSDSTRDATRRAYDYLLENGLRAHSDFYIPELSTNKGA